MSNTAEQGIIPINAAKQQRFRFKPGKLEYSGELTAPPADIRKTHQNQKGDKPAGHPAGEFKSAEKHNDTGDPLRRNHINPTGIDGILARYQKDGTAGSE